MSEIKKLIERLCPDGVEYKKLGEICKTISAPRKLQKNEYQDEGLFPVIDQGQEFIVGYTDETEGLLPSSEYVLYGDHTRIVKYYLGSFMQGADGLKILKFNNLILTRYAYHAICHYNIPSVGYRRHWSLAKEIDIPVPPIEVQSKIVEILDNFTELEAELEIKLEAELEARRKQYEYYRNQLLTFDKVGGARFDVKWMKLGEICDTLSGFPFDSSKFKDEGIQLMRGANIKRGYFDFSSELNKYWESSEGLEKYLLEPNDIIISMDGSLVGKSFCYLKKEHLPLLLVQRVARLRTKENFKYIYYNITNSFSDYVDKKKTAGAIPHISMKDINGFTIPLPPLEEQKRIVSILDRFEALTTDLQSGLPAEIEARRKQYEYYREKLLSFKRKEF